MRENPSEESSAEEPYIVKVYDANDCVDIHTAVNYKGGLCESHAFLKTHYLMSDGTWRIGESYAKGQWYDKPYKYRYILSASKHLLLLGISATRPLHGPKCRIRFRHTACH